MQNRVGFRERDVAIYKLMLSLYSMLLALGMQM
jgi:hypothetical protein